MIDITGLGNILISEITKFKSKIKQLDFTYFGFSLRVKGSKNSPVFTKDIVDIPHEIIGVTVQFIVMTSAALVRAKSFV